MRRKRQRAVVPGGGRGRGHGEGGAGSRRGRGRGHGEGGAGVTRGEAQAILAEGLPSSVGRFSWATACVSRGNEPSGALGHGRSLRFYRPKHLPRYSQLAR